MTDIGHIGPALPLLGYGSLLIWNGLSSPNASISTSKIRCLGSSSHNWMIILKIVCDSQLMEIIGLVSTGITLSLIHGLKVIPATNLYCSIGHSQSPRLTFECFATNWIHFLSGILCLLCGGLSFVWYKSKILRSLYPNFTFAIFFLCLGLFMATHNSESKELDHILYPEYTPGYDRALDHGIHASFAWSLIFTSVLQFIHNFLLFQQQHKPHLNTAHKGSKKKKYYLNNHYNNQMNRTSQLSIFIGLSVIVNSVILTFASPMIMSSLWRPTLTTPNVVLGISLLFSIFIFIIVLVIRLCTLDRQMNDDSNSTTGDSSSSPVWVELKPSTTEDNNDTTNTNV